MSQDIQYMRNFVSLRYGERAIKWIAHVAEMPDDQVMAIYFRMVEEKPKPKPEPPPISPPEIKEDSDDPPTLF